MIQMNHQSLCQLIDEDISWLKRNTDDTLERKHIIQILNERKGILI